MRPIGFSTGALAKGDARRGVDLQRALGTTAVELSALRESELEPLVEIWRDLDLSGFEWISVHAPSRLSEMSEEVVVQWLAKLPAAWPVIVHPNVIRNPEAWRTLGSRLCLENMDERKPVGRTVGELLPYFETLPEAGFCLDLGHARQIDPTLSVATSLVRNFGDRLRQVHVSELDFESRHIPLGYGFRESVRPLLAAIGPSTPLIIESVVEGDDIRRELETVRRIASAEVLATR